MVRGFSGIRIYSIVGAPNGFIKDSYPDAKIDYQPGVKYRVDKDNAFDSSIIHRRGAYCVDRITVMSPITPALYDNVYAMLLRDVPTYIEFYRNNVRKQFKITSIVDLPTCPDDLNEYPDLIKFTVESRYTLPQSIVNFTYIIQEFGNEFYKEK